MTAYQLRAMFYMKLGIIAAVAISIVILIFILTKIIIDAKKAKRVSEVSDEVDQLRAEVEELKKQISADNEEYVESDAASLEEDIIIIPRAELEDITPVKAEPVVEEVKEEVIVLERDVPAAVEEEQGTDIFDQRVINRIPFKDKILGAEKNVQDYYDILNNEFLSYKKIHARVSAKCASYRFGRDLIAKISYRGKTMKLHLALPIADFPETVYFQKDLSDVKAYEEVPFTVKVKSERGANNGIKLIAALCERIGTEKKRNYEPIDSIKALLGIIDYKNQPESELFEETNEEKEEIKVVEPEEELMVGDAEESETAIGLDNRVINRIPFNTKILAATDEVKSYYDTLNNEFLSYKKIHARVSAKCASYRFGRDLIAKISYRGKTMKLHLALPVSDFPETVYFQKDLSEIRAYEEVPFTVKIKSDRGTNNGVKLIAALCERVGTEKKRNYEPIDSIKVLEEYGK